MGDHAENALDYFERGIGHIPKRTHWVTRTGERVRISEMANSHLVNALRMLLRRHTIEWGEAQLSLAERLECTDVEAFVTEEWPELVEEARKRKLEWLKPEAA